MWSSLGGYTCYVSVNRYSVICISFEIKMGYGVKGQESKQERKFSVCYALECVCRSALSSNFGP